MSRKIKRLKVIKKWFARRHRAIHIVHNQPLLIDICRKAEVDKQIDLFEPLIRKYMDEVEMGGVTESGLYVRLTKDIDILSKADGEARGLIDSIAKNVRIEMRKEGKKKVATHPVIDRVGACMVLARYFVKAFKEYDLLNQ